MRPITGPVRVLVAALALAPVTGAGQARLHAPEHPSGRVDKAPVHARHWMVAAANPLAVDAGDRILAQGGSAVDAAIAVQLVLGLVEPQSSGIGGGGFMLVHDARSQRLIAYDGRETAPAAATPDRFLKNGRPLEFYDAVIGGKSVGVPGVVRLLEVTHRRHGRIAWARLFEPAIALAERGFPMSPRLHELAGLERYITQPRLRAYLYDASGKVLPVGTVLRNAAYAKTLRAIARDGARAFYEGDIARDIVETVTRHPWNPGDMTVRDLAAYEVVVREPVCGGYRVYRVCGFPLPSSGGIAVLQMLKILERFDLASLEPASFFAVHFVSEAGRLAFADRAVYAADPAFYTPPEGLLDDAYLRERASLIRPDATLRFATPGTPPRSREPRKAADASLELPSTSHVSIVDRYGNAVAMTTSIEDQFGSRLMTAGGFLLNNELTDFSFVPEVDGAPVANRVQGGKRPRSSMAPTIAYDARGRVAIVTGSPGGSAIINYVAKSLVAIIDWDLDPQSAAALPNFGSRNGPTELEAGTEVASLASKLRAIGADVAVLPMTSGLHTIVRTRDGWVGGADPRREGAVRGR
jgi:gamma-glutamyltranspeptidase/glutathione hydrolase